MLSRRDSVLLAQLRSGHCHRLAAYRSIVDANVAATCPHCSGEPETIENWLRDCPASANQRKCAFGGTVPPMSALYEDPLAVLEYAHGLSPM